MSQVTTYIQGHDKATLASHQSRTAEKQADYLIPHIQPDHKILDIGCGPGTITCGFAKLAHRGSVVGVDYSEEVLTQARHEVTSQNLTNVTFQPADAHALPFEDETFDIVHCHALLIHVPEAASVVKEMRRVCKTGGFVAAREPDWTTCVIHPYNPILERWKEVHMQLKQQEGSEPNAGRHLAEWAIAAGFETSQVQITSDVLQYTGREQTRWWGELYAARMSTEFGKRAVKSGLVKGEEEVQGFAEAYREWGGCEFGIWAMMHMRLLARK